MKTTRTLLLLLLLLLQSPLFLPAVLAQVPPHRPGTICFTAQFWCWANPPGPPGGRCVCASPYGPIGGTLG